MNFEQMMLNTRTYQYFRIYNTLISMPQGNYSINEVAQRVNLPYPKVYKLIQGLVGELGKIKSAAAELIASTGSLDTSKLIIDLNTLRYHLIANQLPYQVIYYLLTKSDPTIDDFCTQYHTSRATVFRKIKPLNDQLHQFDLHFTFSRMNILGDERKTILFLFCIFRLTTEGAIWPFSQSLFGLATKAKNQFMQRIQVPPEFENSEAFPLLIAIIGLRLRQGNTISDYSRYAVLLKGNDNYKSHLLDTELVRKCHFPNFTPTRKLAVLHFGYHLLNLIPVFRKDDAYLRSMIDYFYTRQNIIWHFATDFLHYMQKNSFKEPHRLVLDNVLLGNVINVALAYYLFDGRIPTLSRIANFKRHILTGGYDYGQLYQDINNYFAQLPTEFSIFKGDQHQMIQALYHLLLPVYTKYKHDYHIRIGLMIPGDSMVYQHYLDLYQGFNYMDVEPYAAHAFKQYDLIFTSSFSFYLKAKDPRVIYFHQGAEQSEIMPLLKARDYYLKKFPALPEIGAIY
ncbi:helix-turn-helix domain-containing protein [Loigolactobacillus rennini]|uniref:Mga helix-turn-helix domain-containing protein n=1 Tax=Loigolactobacillus rennini DSM 20253 TaxID=1423796 RepID=A0A0R2D1V7_9LACO|nr:helix-turn-helix domain-containing protein [Loigolactobacillus rennini]KRM97338.1 hypothetical protein FC24_GL001595 [Loigolactobacillus rennini DSM 20253]